MIATNDRPLDDDDVQSPLFGYRITIYQSPTTETSGASDLNATDLATNSSSLNPDQGQVLSYSLVSDLEGQGSVSLIDLTGEDGNQKGDADDKIKDRQVTGANSSVDQEQDDQDDNEDHDLMATSEPSPRCNIGSQPDWRPRTGVEPE